MSGTKTTGTVVAGGATAALPVTGSPVAMIALAGVAMVVVGFLLFRASRYQRESV